jgi:predicted NBD/HSP70 family sugar kinase
MRIKTNKDAFASITRGVAQGGVRVANERAVLAILVGKSGASNADVARISGLGPQTTSRILLELEARDLILRGDVLRGRRGQPATPYSINPNGAFSIGVEIGWDHLEFVLQNFLGIPQKIVRRRHDGPITESVFDTIAAEVAALRDALPEAHRGRLAGVGVTSPISLAARPGDAGIGAKDPAAWAEIDLADRVSRATGLTATWASDGNAIALSELVNLPTPRPSAIAAFFLGTYMSGAVIGRSRLLDWARGLDALPGAIIVAGPDGRAVPAQDLASLQALGRRLEAAGIGPMRAPPRDWKWDEIEPHVAPWLDQAASALAQAIFSTCAITGIEHAVIDGDLPSAIRDRVVVRTRDHLAQLPMLLPDVPQVDAGTVGPIAAALGAANMLIYQQYFSRDWELFDA